MFVSCVVLFPMLYFFTPLTNDKSHYQHYFSDNYECFYLFLILVFKIKYCLFERRTHFWKQEKFRGLICVTDSLPYLFDLQFFSNLYGIDPFN